MRILAGAVFMVATIAGCAVQQQRSYVSPQSIHKISRLDVVYIANEKFKVTARVGRGISARDVAPVISNASAELSQEMGRILPGVVKEMGVHTIFHIETPMSGGKIDFHGMEGNADIMTIAPASAEMFCYKAFSDLVCSSTIKVMTMVFNRKSKALMWSVATDIDMSHGPMGTDNKKKVMEYWQETMSGMKKDGLL